MRKRYVRITIYVAFVIAAVGAWPLASEYQHLRRCATHLASHLKDYELIELNVSPCMRKFRGVIVEATVDSQSERRALEDAVRQADIPANVSVIIHCDGETFQNTTWREHGPGRQRNGSE